MSVSIFRHRVSNLTEELLRLHFGEIFASQFLSRRSADGVLDLTGDDIRAILDACPIGECTICSVLFCPFSDPLHFHHDGCPSCFIWPSRNLGEGLGQIPKIVCLCGSTRFWKTFQEMSLAQTLKGNIVLSIGAATSSDKSHFGHLPDEEQQRIKERLDSLHKKKIELADTVIVLNVDGYIGPSTRSEIEFAEALGKVIHYMEEVR